MTQNGTSSPVKSGTKHRTAQQKGWTHRSASASAPAVIGSAPPASPNLIFETRSETAATEDSCAQWYTSHKEANGSTEDVDYKEEWLQGDLGKDTNGLVDEASYVNKRGSPSACIFVASLTKDKNDEELNISVTNHFSQWGELLNVKVLKDWMERPYAFVQYERTEDAKRALKEAPGTLLDGRSIRCEPARVNRTICLAAYEAPLKEDEIRAELSTFGEIEDMTKLDTYFAPIGQCECVFVKFCYRDDAIKAFLTLRAPQDHQKWCVEWASNIDAVSASQLSRARPLDIPLQIDRTSVFVGNLDEQVTEADLQAIFAQYGEISHIRLIRKPRIDLEQKRVFAFVKYNTEKEAAEAVEKENGSMLLDRPMRVAFREHRMLGPYTKIGKHGRVPDRPHPPGLGYPASVSPYVVAAAPVPVVATNAVARHATSLDKVDPSSSNVGDSTREACKSGSSGKKVSQDESKDHAQLPQQQQTTGATRPKQGQATHQQHSIASERPSSAVGQTYPGRWQHTAGVPRTRGTFGYGIHPPFDYGKYMGPPPMPGYYNPQAPMYRSGSMVQDVDINAPDAESNNQAVTRVEGRVGNDDMGFVYPPVGFYDYTSSPYYPPGMGYYSDPRATQPVPPPSSFNRPGSYYHRRGSASGIYSGGTTYYYGIPPMPMGPAQFTAPGNAPGYAYPPAMAYGAAVGNPPSLAQTTMSPNSSTSSSSSNDLPPPEWNGKRSQEEAVTGTESKSV